jgi:hypothetical protein
VALARAVLEQDISDAAWAAEVGPALSQSAAAKLLGKSSQAVSKDPHLLRIHNRNGRPVYPVLQFDGRRLLPGIGEVVSTLVGPLLPLTVASWLAAGNRWLGGRAPVAALRDNDIEAVSSLVRQLGSSAR